MTNKVYLSTYANQSLLSLKASEAQVQGVLKTIDSLEEGEAAGSRILYADDSPGGGLRAVNAGDFRILYRYDPESHTVIVADVAPATSDERVAALV